jgi:hypothetical protein
MSAGDNNPKASNKTKSSKTITDQIKDAVTNAGDRLDVNVNKSGILYYTNNPDFSPTTKKESQSAQGISSNVLHKFASYNTIFTLSGISEEELKNQTYLSNVPHDIIARSGGIGNPNFSEGKYQDEINELKTRATEGGKQHREKERTKGSNYDESACFLTGGLDIFFEEVNILSTVGPNSERGLANFTKMEFQLHEPFNITLIEKIRATAFINGYWDYQDAPLLLTIEWKGWDEHGKEQKDTRLKRYIPIRIVRVEFEVDAGGARYQCIAVAADDFAHDDRFKFPRRNIDIARSTWKDWTKELKRQLNEQMENEKKEGLRELNDEYNFVLSDEVIQDAKDWGNEATLTHSVDIKKGGRGGANMSATIAAVRTTIDSYTSLVKLFEDALRSGLGYTDIVNGFWYQLARKLMNDSSIGKTANPTSMKKVAGYLTSQRFVDDLRKEENQYINWFMIKPKFEVIGTGRGKKWDSIRKLHPKRITFVAVRQKIHVLKFIKPGVTLGNVDWSKYIRKKYNYIYTGENVDIQNLKIDYKTAWFMRNIRPFVADEKEKGKFKDFKDEFEDKLNKAFGVEDHPDIPFRQEPSIQRGKNVVNPDEKKLASEAKNQQFYDYLTNPQVDMMRVELTILGDPAYVCQDQFTNIQIALKDNEIVASPKFAGQGSWNYKYGSFNSEAYQPLILLTYKLPDDFSDKKGYWFEKFRRSSFFSGVYQVVKIESSISQGQFTQVLHCVRMNNQKGEGAKAQGLHKFKTFFDNEEKEDLANKRKIKSLITAVDTMGSSSGIKAEDYIDATKDKWW